MNLLQIGPYEIDGNLTTTKYVEFLQRLRRICLRSGMSREEFSRATYQHDGAPAHTSHLVRRKLHDMFGGRFIGKGGMRDWPPRSPDLNPLDFFLWGHIKSQVYRTPVNSRAELQQQVERALQTVTQEMLQRCVSSFISRARCCIEMDGGHFEHLLI